MNNNRRVLVFYPHNYVHVASGTHARFLQLARYFSDRGLTADLISFDGFTNCWDEASVKTANQFFQNVTPVPWRDTWSRQLRERLLGARPLEDLAIPPLHDAWQKSFSVATYTHAVVSYAYWGALLDNTPGTVTTVIDLHDCLTLNQMRQTGEAFTGYGRMLEEECRVISRFDHALSISRTERALLESLCTGVIFHDVPIAFAHKVAQPQPPVYDLLFVGSENHFNCGGLRWFLDKVFPLVASSPRMAVAGRVCNAVPLPAHVTALHHVADLDTVYAATRLVICPLLGGTGLKIKVIDALSHGVPVITTRWGVDGAIPGFTECCVVADSAAAFAAAIDKCLAEPDQLKRMADAAKAYSVDNYSDDSVWQRLDRIFINDPQPRIT